MPTEIWKDVVGFEGHYQVSNLGNVRSLPRLRLSRGGSFAPVKGKMLVPQLKKDGYFRVHLRKDEINTYPSVHRLVAQAFLDNSENKPCVNHKDGVKVNNTVDNLEWCTVSENTIHAIRCGLYTPPVIKDFTLYGDNHPNTKISQSDISVIFEMRKSGKKLKSIADSFNVGISQIHRILKFKSRLSQ